MDRREGTWIDDRLDGFVFFHTGAGPTRIERWEAGRRIPDGAKERDREAGQAGLRPIIDGERFEVGLRWLRIELGPRVTLVNG